MESCFEANETLLVIGLPVDTNENDRNLKIQTLTFEKSSTSDVFGKEVKKSNLKSNLQCGTKEESNYCDVWNEQFSDRNCLKKHCPTQTNEKLYSCDVCKKEFSELYVLNHHLRIHTKENPYSCNVCRKQFSRKDSFIIHSRTHTNEKPFACDVCRKEFSQKKYLRLHFRTHTNEKPYSCHVCNKRFYQKSDLRKHYITHTNEKPYSCYICNKGFSQQPYLSEHYRMHTNEKPFSCDVCGKEFSWRASFRVHLRTHMTLKPFSCDVCNKAFSQRCHLNRHSRTCKGKEATEASSHRQFLIDAIQLYKELPCLWKIADPDYHDKNKRGRAMKQLMGLLKTKDITVNKKKVHTRINSKRCNKGKQSNKVKASLKSGDSVNKVHIPKLWYYNLLTFLEEQNVGSTSGAIESVLDSMPFRFDEDCEEDSNESASVPSPVAFSNSATMLQDSSQDQITSQCFKKSQSKAEQVLKKISRRLDQLLEKQPAIKQKYDIFGECVAETLRSLQPNMAIYCQKLINEAIFLAEIGNLNVSSKIVTSVSNSTNMNPVT